MQTLRTGTATTIAAAGIPSALLIPSTLTGRVAALAAVIIAAGAVLIFVPKDPQEEEAVGRLGGGGRDARDRAALGDVEAFRSIQRRRNAVICLITGLIFGVLILIGYGPWSH